MYIYKAIDNSFIKFNNATCGNVEFNNIVVSDAYIFLLIDFIAFSSISLTFITLVFQKGNLLTSDSILSITLSYCMSNLISL